MVYIPVPFNYLPESLFWQGVFHIDWLWNDVDSDGKFSQVIGNLCPPPSVYSVNTSRFKPQVQQALSQWAWLPQSSSKGNTFEAQNHPRETPFLLYVFRHHFNATDRNNAGYVSDEVFNVSVHLLHCVTFPAAMASWNKGSLNDYRAAAAAAAPAVNKSFVWQTCSSMCNIRNSSDVQFTCVLICSVVLTLLRVDIAELCVFSFLKSSVILLITWDWNIRVSLSQSICELRGNHTGLRAIQQAATLYWTGLIDLLRREIFLPTHVKFLPIKTALAELFGRPCCYYVTWKDSVY